MPTSDQNHEQTQLTPPSQVVEDLGDTQVKAGDYTHQSRTFPPPTTAGYEPGVELARGGMGVVHAARDLALDREVAVKSMLNGMDSTEFIREARITARLQHPGIPPVHALGQLSDGRPFLAMKLIKGETLKAILAAQPVSTTERGRLVAAFEQICQAVGYAHSQGIVHRDLKPDNVMVGAFGEVQVMDWGLAKVIDGTDISATTSPDGTARHENVAATVAGRVKGTPAYMAPEQARGELVDTRADVFALGGILAAILTNQPPFVSNNVLDTIIRAASGDLADVNARLDGCGADAELIGIAKQCLAARAADRPTDGMQVVALVAGYRSGVEARLRQAEQGRVAAAAKAEEQRKRQRAQLTLAGVVVAVAVGIGIAINLVQKQRSDDRVAAEKAQGLERLEAEEKRQADLQDADRVSRTAQRKTRADTLIEALATAETGAATRLIDDLTEFRDLTGLKLKELAKQPIITKPGLHARLTLLAHESQWIDELATYLPVCRPEELLTIRMFIKPYAKKIIPGLWEVLSDKNAGDGSRLRTACALAELVPDDQRWPIVAADVAAIIARENPLRAGIWAQALEPIREPLLPALMAQYTASRARLEGGKLAVSELAAEATGFDLTANVLAQYAAEQPIALAELALTVDARHYPLFERRIRANRNTIVTFLKAEVTKPVAGPSWAISEQVMSLAGLGGSAVVGLWLDTELLLAAQGKRKGHAAALLIALGEAETAWPIFRLSAAGDPTARNYLSARLAGIGADPLRLIQRFETERDVSSRRAQLIALGDFPAELIPRGEREALATRLLMLYREHPDPGLHSAIDWLLRHKWGKNKELTDIDTELASLARVYAATKSLSGAVPLVPFGATLVPVPAPTAGRDWFVNGEGQTYAVVRGPVEFMFGSPATEPGRVESEHFHLKKIDRTFAIATKEVTLEQILRYKPNSQWAKRFNQNTRTPVVGMHWYQCAEYCNWLSAQEGIPPNEWCYEVNKDGKYAEGMRIKADHLKLAGYRLPTEEEWEYACRGGTVTPRYYGRGEELLSRYGWFVKTSEDRTWPVGQLRPNELGLFDILGNAFEWTGTPAGATRANQGDDITPGKQFFMTEKYIVTIKGCSYDYLSSDMRSAFHLAVRPGGGGVTIGFRLARTISK